MNFNDMALKQAGLGQATAHSIPAPPPPLTHMHEVFERLRELQNALLNTGERMSQLAYNIDGPYNGSDGKKGTSEVSPSEMQSMPNALIDLIHGCEYKLAEIEISVARVSARIL